MNNTKSIGIIDSGIGGFSIYKEIQKILPMENVIYIADKKYLPYGEKTSELIKKRADLLVSFLKKKGVKTTIIACNTASVSALDYIRKKHPDIHIIGTVPAIKSCAEKTRNGNIGILCTPKTAESTYQKKLIEKFAPDKNTCIQPCPGLVEAIEEGDMKKINFSEMLLSLKQNNIDAIALGCTHFPLVKREIAQALKDDTVLILDSGEAIARQTQKVLRENDILAEKKEGKGKIVFYTTADKEKFDIMIKRHLEVGVKSQLIEV